MEASSHPPEVTGHCPAHPELDAKHPLWDASLSYVHRPYTQVSVYFNLK